MNKLKLYKVLRKDMNSPYRNFPYEIGKTYRESNIDLSNNDCSRGFYATDIEGILYSYKENRVILECEVWGRRKEIDIFKRRFEYIRLVRKVPKSEIRAKAKALESGLGYKLSEAFFPIKPLTGKAKTPTAYDIKLLKKWAKIEPIGIGYVGMATADYIRKTITKSKWAYVFKNLFQYSTIEMSIPRYLLDEDFLDDFLGDTDISSRYESTNDLIFAYKSSLFPGIEEWEGVNHESGKNPYQPAISLWKRGFIASFDGSDWRLHSGPKAKVVYKINKKDILS